jgi:hypothetical protein
MDTAHGRGKINAPMVSGIVRIVSNVDETHPSSPSIFFLQEINFPQA